MADQNPEHKLYKPLVKTQNIVANRNANNSIPPSGHSLNNTKDDNAVDLKPRENLPKAEEEPIEQDLTDEDDTYEEPSIQKYLPGIYVDVKLKTRYIEQAGRKVVIPMIVDFYSECLKRYGDESNFIYEESYLEDMKAKNDGFHGEHRNKISKCLIDNTICGPDDKNNDGSAISSQNVCEFGLQNSCDTNCTDSQKNVYHEDNIDDVVWLKNRPNDPLLRCIRSITDRLNIQGIVGDPSSYLKEGGDDMHYDIDDPFIDDSAMLSELKMSRSDILLKRDMEREFSDWSEDDEDVDIKEVKPSDFVANYYDAFKMEMAENVMKENECALFFNPGGWRKYISRIPKQFLTIYYEFENSSRNITDYVTDKMLRVKVKEFLESIFKRLVRIQEPKTKNKSIVTDLGKSENDVLSKRRIRNSDEFKAFGLNCILPWRIIGVNGRILRWIIKSISSTTNAISPYDIHKEWLTHVVMHNERVILDHTEKLRLKLTTKLQAIEKRDHFVSTFSESIKSLSKNIGNIRRILKEYKDHLNSSKSTQTKKDGGVKVKEMNCAVKGSNTDPYSPEDEKNINSETEHYSPSNYNANVELSSQNEPVKESFGDNMDAENDAGDSSKEDDSVENNDDLSSVERTKETVIDSKSTVNLKDNAASKETDKSSEVRITNDGISSFLKQSKIWKRIKGVYSLYRLVGNDMLVFIQMVNLSLSVVSTIGDTEFSCIVEEIMSYQPLFDQSYKRLGDIVAKILNETDNIKVNIPPDVNRIVIIHLQQILKVKDLFERKNKRPLLFIDNSRLQAAPGKVVVRRNKDRTKRATPKDKDGGGAVIIDKGNGQTKKGSVTKDDSNTQGDLEKNNSQFTEKGDKHVGNPEVKRKRRNTTPNTVKSMKDLFLSRINSSNW